LDIQDCSEDIMQTASRRAQWTMVVLSLLVILLPAAAYAQSAASRGSISGLVTDTQGKAVPGAQVTVRNLDST
jgi:hypothetical protein